MTVEGANTGWPGARLIGLHHFRYPMVFLALVLVGCSTRPAPISVSPQGGSVHIGDTLTISGTQNGSAIADGQWAVVGGSANGSITAAGIYTPPSILPSPNVVTITFEALEQSSSTSITILNPEPTIQSVQPSALSQLSNTIVVSGKGFIRSSQILQDGVAISTKFLDDAHVQAVVSFPAITVASTSIAVSNPSPGPSISSTLTVPVAISPIVISPQGASVRAGSTLMLRGVQQGMDLPGSSWSVVGGPLNGTISEGGVYTPPAVLPSANVVNVTCSALGQTAATSITLFNPIPVITGVQPVILTQISNQVVVSGSGFVEGSQVMAASNPVTTTFVDGSHLRATVTLPSKSARSISLSVSNPGPGASSSVPAVAAASVLPLSISSPSGSVRVGGMLSLSGNQDGTVVMAGTWAVLGVGNGEIGTDGVYVPPAVVPSSNVVSITFSALGQTATTAITLLNPLPNITGVIPSVFSEISNSVVVSGNGFINGSQIIAGSTPIATTFVDPTHLKATLILPGRNATSVSLAVSNPGPGASASAATVIAASVLPLTISSPASMVRLGDTVALSGMQGGAPVAGGTWAIAGGANNGKIGTDGVYVPPATVPSSNVISVTYSAIDQIATTSITILNPTPRVTGTAPAVLDQITNQIVVAGSGFVRGAQVIASGTPIKTTFLDNMHLKATVVLPSRDATTLSLAVLNPGPGASSSATATIAASVLPLKISSPTNSVRIGDKLSLSGLQGNLSVTGGKWTVVGGAVNGSIDAMGSYNPPPLVPALGQVNVGYAALDQTATATLNVLNPKPSVQVITPSTLTQFSTALLVTGTGFIKQSKVMADGQEVETIFQDSTHLKTTLTVSGNTVTSVAVSVSNPDPGSVLSDIKAVPVQFTPLSISPATLSGGNFKATLRLPGMPPDPVVTIDGVALNTTTIDSATVSVSGYLPFWKSATSTFVLLPAAAASPFASLAVPIAPTAVSYDVASRFALQAGFGPRHDIIEHIQQVGLEAFVDEQLKVPPDTYSDPVSGRRDFLLNTVKNNTQLRLRTAWAFQSFMPGQGIFAQQSVLPWEQTLEADAFTNFRQIMLDAASDPNLTTLLNLPGNQTPRQQGQHPNQNFARELLQLFTIGPVMLNDDGSAQLDSSGNPIPAYGEDTVQDLSRVFTGWTYAPIVNKPYSAYGIDYTQKLTSLDWQHDHGSKTLFGNAMLPPGQTAEQDRKQALDTIFAHTNVPPFISRRLIQRLVKSQPTPAYIARIAAIFKDDGTGTRGNLAAVIKAVLLDPEARKGDLQPAADDGYVQDPLSALAFAMILMGVTSTDGSASYYPDQLGERWWFTPSVFAYYSPDYVIPGTTINSPEFQLLTSTSIVQRSQLLWGMINGGQAGFEPWKSGWLSTTFPTLPAFVDALDHVLYHGRMTETERATILTYCSGLQDTQSQLRTALFLALNNDAYTVAQ